MANFPSPGHTSVSRIGSFDNEGDGDGDGDFCPRKCCGCHIEKRRKQTEAPEGAVDIFQEVRRLQWRAKLVPRGSRDVFVASEICICICVKWFQGQPQGHKLHYLKSLFLTCFSYFY